MQISKCWFQIVCFTFLSSEKLAVAMMLSLPTWATSQWVKSGGDPECLGDGMCVLTNVYMCIYFLSHLLDFFLVLNQNMPKLELNSRL